MEAFLQTHGSYLVITIVLILTGSGLPLPEEVPIITAAILSVNEILNPWIAFPCCLFGAVVGDGIMYWIGYHFGRGVLRKRFWPRWITPKREEHIEKLFRDHGLKVFFVVRFLVVLRSPVYLTAGILRVSFRRFILTDLLCATFVVGTFFGLTYFFGQTIPTLIRKAEIGLTIGVAVALVGGGFYLWRRYRVKILEAWREFKDGDDSAPAEAPQPQSESDQGER
jgi:membrane protein DedA with SNARE-associated domain